MRNNLSEATFIIPIRIESLDRLRNVITSTAFLLENFDTNIIIKEVDSESVFERDALPILKDILEVDINVKHIFEKSDEPLFHRQRVLNEMIMESDTEVVVNYDATISDSSRTWMVNKEEIEHIYNKHSEFFADRRYPDEN